MYKAYLRFSQLSIATLGVISGASLLMAAPSMAQLGTVDRGTNQNSDPLARPNTGDLKVFDFIHQANFGTMTWDAAAQEEQLNSEAAKFRAAQQRAIQQRQQQSNSPDGGDVRVVENQLP